jgi:hypothetical protein
MRNVFVPSCIKKDSTLRRILPTFTYYPKYKVALSLKYQLRVIVSNFGLWGDNFGNRPTQHLAFPKIPCSVLDILTF